MVVVFFVFFLFCFFFILYLFFVVVFFFHFRQADTFCDFQFVPSEEGSTLKGFLFMVHIF